MSDSILFDERREIVEALHDESAEIEWDGIVQKSRCALRDLELLWNVLPDDQLEELFDPEQQGRSLRGTIQNVLSLLYLGAERNGDDVEGRFAAAIQRAEAARDKHAEVMVDVRLSDLASPQETLSRLEAGEWNAVSAYELEQLYASTEIEAERVADILGGLDSEVERDKLVADIAAEQEILDGYPRPPMSIVVSVEHAPDEEEV